MRQSAGSDLEKAFRGVLERFLPEAGFIIDRDRIQSAGTQFGCDLRVQIRRSRGESHSTRVLFECKNYDSTLRFNEIFEKPFQAEIGGEHIDLWILVSPRRSIANDVDLRFRALQQKFPFPIVLMTPDEGVESLFALYEDCYQIIYRHPLPEVDRQTVIAHWRDWFKEQLSISRHLQLLTKLFQVVDPEAIAAKCHQDEQTYKHRARVFYRGKIPSWDDIASDLDVRRTYVLQQLNEFIVGATRGVSFALLVSEAGAGKSTALRRVALELARGGFTVLFTPSLPWGLDPMGLRTDLEKLLRRCRDRHVVIIIDNVASVFQAVYDLCSYLQEQEVATTVIAADRAARWRAVMTPKEGVGIQQPLPTERQLKLTLTQLGPDEVSGLIDNLKRAQVSERIVETDAKTLCKEFIRRFHGDLLVTLHEIIIGQDFDQIIRVEEREFRAQWPRHRMAYALTAALHQFGLTLPLSLLARLAGGSGSLEAGASFAELIAESGEDRLLTLDPDRNRIATRHEVVARAVYEGLPAGEQQIIFKGILQDTDPANKFEVSTIATLLVSPDLRRELWALPFAGELYEIGLRRLPAHPKLFHAALFYAASRGDIRTARQVFQSTPIEHRTPALNQDLAKAEQQKGNFTEARSLYRSGLSLSGQEVNAQIDCLNLSLAFTQGIDLKLLTDYALFEHRMTPESPYAIEMLQAAVRAHVADAHVYHTLGRLLTRQGDTTGAIAVYSDGEQFFPKSAPFFHLAKAHLEPSLEARVKFLKAALEQGVEDPALYTQYAISLKGLGQMNEAVEIFKRALRASLADAPLYQAYAMMLKEQGRFEEAEKQLQEGLKADPTHGPLHQAYAMMLKEQGRFEEAEKQLQEGLKADPTHGPLYQAYAMMLKEQGRFEEARSVSKEMIRLQPGEVWHLIQWMYLLFYGLDAMEEVSEVVKELLAQQDLGKLEKKERYQIKFTERLISWRQQVLTGDAEAQKNVERHYQYAARLIDHKNFQRGTEELRKLLDESPGHARAYWRLAYTLTSHNDIEEGLEHAQQAVLLDPEKHEYRLQLVYSSIYAGQIDLAHAQLDWLLQQSPANTNYLRLRGFAFARAEQWNEAETAYRAAIDTAQTSQERAQALKNLAQTLMQQQVPELYNRALQLLERAWALYPPDPAIFITRKQIAERTSHSTRIDNPYQLMRKRLEPGDPITVQVYRIDKASSVQAYYYGVPGRLPWVERANSLQVGQWVDETLVEGVTDNGELQLGWPKDIQLQEEARIQQLEKTQQMNLEPGQYIHAVVSDFRPYGVLVDYRGISGLIHRGRVPEPQAFDPTKFSIQKGEPIRCKVLSIRSDGKLELAWEESSDLST